MRSLTMLLVAASLGLCGAVLAACGDRSDLIPADAASRMDDRLDEALFELAEGNCRQARSQLSAARSQAQDLPESVDPELRANLERGLEHAIERVEVDCKPKTTPPTTTTTPTVTTTEPPPQTETTPPPTTTPTTPPDGSGSGGSPPDDDDEGNGGGGNNGGNNDGGNSGGNNGNSNAGNSGGTGVDG